MSGYEPPLDPNTGAPYQPLPLAPAGPSANLPQPGPQEQVLVQLGEIACTQHYVIIPAGAYQLRGAQFLVMDHTRKERYTPTWAIVIAVIGALLFLIGLLFLLVKEERTTGYVHVTVQGPGYYHQTQLPVTQHDDIASIQQWVGYARNLAAAA